MRLAKAIHVSLLVLSCAIAPAIAGAAERPRATNYRGHAAVGAIQVQPATLTEILSCLLGPGVQVSNATMTAAPGAAGLFTGGVGIVGIDSGIVLSSGNIGTLVGPNTVDDASFDNLSPGDPDLNGLIPGYETFDATVLEFDFECPTTTAVSFQYVFASEEYNEWVNSAYNDVFGFFLNGVNIALAPTVCSSPGIPVAINNVNCGNPFSPPGGPNCDCYRNNDLDDGGGSINTEMDGLTQVFYATGVIQAGVNHIKLAIADAGDHVLDSNVMIRCQSFNCGAPPDVGACCEGDECFLLSRDECDDAGATYLGDGVTCYPTPCTPTPVKSTTWGSIKGLYR